MTWGKAVTVWCDVEVRSESELLSLAKFGRGFPDRLLTQITGDAIDKRPAAFCKTAGTYTRYRTMVAAILNLAKARGWLREVPKLAVRRDKKGAKRHTWATWHVQNGTPLDVLQKLGGWSDLRMVMNYAHHSPSYLAGFADNTRKKT